MAVFESVSSARISTQSVLERNPCNLDKIYETRLNQGLSQAWNKGFGEPRDIEQRISLLSRRMSADAEVAHVHFDTIPAIAGGTTRTPGADAALPPIQSEHFTTSTPQ